jgi:integrating conjugative element protein (TIGR03761 family)
MSPKRTLSVQDEEPLVERILPHNADPISDYRTAAAHPSSLRSSSPDFIYLHTSTAKKLVHGRRPTPHTGNTPPTKKEASKEAGIIGLFRYADMIRIIRDAAVADDPYADWWLIQITERLEELQQEISQHQQNYDAKLSARAAHVRHHVGVSFEPVPVPITFHNPYAWRAAYLVIDYDTLVRTGAKVKEAGLMIPSDTARINSLTESSMRALFQFVSLWKNLSLTRDDVRQNTQRAQQARAAMGEGLPQDVLDGTWRDQYAPAIKRARNRSEVKREAGESESADAGGGSGSPGAEVMASGEPAANLDGGGAPGLDNPFFAVSAQAEARAARVGRAGAKAGAAKRTATDSR